MHDAPVMATHGTGLGVFSFCIHHSAGGVFGRTWKTFSALVWWAGAGVRSDAI